MAKSLFAFQSHQDYKVAAAVKAGQTVAVNLTPGGGFVWPFVTFNGVPAFTLDPLQTMQALDSNSRGKTLAVVTAPSHGKQELQEN